MTTTECICLGMQMNKWNMLWIVHCKQKPIEHNL